ncbi:hypothetical protein C8R44DRAFT_873529 [Mycena epipterygia]|nr:hypothetical protein C8R44DRAFT_873529 [Mycena epipterygia]
MSSKKHPVQTLSTDQLKRQRHAQAQHRYRERNLEKTREDSQLRQERLRAALEASPDTKKEALAKRRAHDADYRERIRQERFINKFGRTAFRAQYVPLYKAHGKKHLPGLRFRFDDDAEERAWRKAQKAGKAEKDKEAGLKMKK